MRPRFTDFDQAIRPEEPQKPEKPGSIQAVLLQGLFASVAILAAGELVTSLFCINKVKVVYIYAVAVLLLGGSLRYGNKCGQNPDCGVAHVIISWLAIGSLLFLWVVPGVIAIWYFATHDPPCVRNIARGG